MLNIIRIVRYRRFGWGDFDVNMCATTTDEWWYDYDNPKIIFCRLPWCGCNITGTTYGSTNGKCEIPTLNLRVVCTTRGIHTSELVPDTSTGRREQFHALSTTGIFGFIHWTTLLVQRHSHFEAYYNNMDRWAWHCIHQRYSICNKEPCIECYTKVRRFCTDLCFATSIVSSTGTGIYRHGGCIPATTNDLGTD